MKVVTILMVITALTIGMIGGTLISKNVSAQSTTPTFSTPIPILSVENQQGTFKSNEESTHEAKESKEWEAQEDAGQKPWMNGINKTETQ